MSASSSVFKLCPHRQLQLSLAAGQKTWRTSIPHQARHLSITRPRYVQPVETAPTSDIPPEDIPHSGGSSQRPSEPNLELQALLEEQDKEFIRMSPTVIGTVARAGTMKQTVAVATNRQYFDKYLHKHLSKTLKRLVHDPADTLAEGDVIKYGLFPPRRWEERVKKGKKNVKFVLREVITPFGLAVDQRTPRVTTPRPKAPTTTRVVPQQRQRGSRR